MVSRIKLQSEVRMVGRFQPFPYRGMSIMRVASIWDNEDGSALLEGAIVLPFLFALIFGVLEYSLFFYQQHIVSTGVQDAARYLARTDPTIPANETTAKNLATTGSYNAGSPQRIQGFDNTRVSVSFSTVTNTMVSGLRPYREAITECGGPNNITIIRVTGSFTYVPIGFLGYFGFTAPTISVAHSERCIGPG